MALPTYASILGRGSSVKAKTEKAVTAAKSAAEIAVGAYGAARLSAALGGSEGKRIGPVPLELGVAAVLIGAGVSGLAGKGSEDLMALGMGSAAGYLGRLGHAAGVQDHAARSGVSGYIGSNGRPGQLTSGQIRQAADRVREAGNTIPFRG